MRRWRPTRVAGTSTTSPQGLVEKLVYRHPHVFGEVEVPGADEVLVNWEKLKAAEAGGASAVDDDIPASLPSLARAAKVQRRAAGWGFEWRSVDSALAALREEVDELAAATSPDDAEAEVGDVLFATVALARKLGVDAESALRRTVRTLLRAVRAVRRRSPPSEGIDVETADEAGAAGAVPGGAGAVSAPHDPDPGRHRRGAARIAPHVRRTPVLDVAPGHVRCRRAAHAEARAAAGDRVVQAARGVQPHAHGRRGARGRRGRERRELRVGRGPRRPRARRHAEIFVPSTLARREDRQGAGHGRRRPRRRRLLRRRLGGRARGVARPARSGCIPSTSPRWWPVRARSAPSSPTRCPTPTTVLVAVGGGGLIGGIASWFADAGARVVGVEPADVALPAYRDAEAGEPVEVPVSGRAADSLGARRMGISRSPSRARATSSASCSSTTRRSSRHSGRSGGSSGCSPSPGAPRRSRR